MSKVSIKIVSKGDEKFIERVFVNGKKELVYAPPKVQTRRPRRHQLRVGKNKTRQKQF